MNTKTCTICNTTLPISEYSTKSGRVKYSRCQTCRRQVSKRRMRERLIFNPTSIREYIIERKGGKCVRCDYDEFMSALEFHHVAPKEKESGLTRLINSFCYGGTESRWEAVEREVAKCIVLCSNCHQAYHQSAWTDIERVKRKAVNPPSIPMPTSIN